MRIIGKRLKQARRQIGMAERCSSRTAASAPLAPNRLSVVASTKWEVERETGLEPATFSLEGSDHLQR
jgi:hypothetical protein